MIFWRGHSATRKHTSGGTTRDGGQPEFCHWLLSPEFQIVCGTRESWSFVFASSMCPVASRGRATICQSAPFTETRSACQNSRFWSAASPVDAGIPEQRANRPWQNSTPFWSIARELVPKVALGGLQGCWRQGARKFRLRIGSPRSVLRTALLNCQRSSAESAWADSVVHSDFMYTYRRGRIQAQFLAGGSHAETRRTLDVCQAQVELLRRLGRRGTQNAIAITPNVAMKEGSGTASMNTRNPASREIERSGI